MPKSESFAPQQWFICTLSKEGFHNWELCKQVELWGIPTNGRKKSLPDCKPGDGLLVYAASRGLKAICQIVGTPRTPVGKSEAPWAGGIYRFGLIVPFQLMIELKDPMAFPFIDQRLLGTSISTTQLRSGFSRVSLVDGKFLYGKLSKVHKDVNL